MLTSDTSHNAVSDGRIMNNRHGLDFIIRPFKKLKKLMATPKGKTLAKFQIMAVVLLISSFGLFWNLGHYSPWEDEAVTALGAKGIVRTGDTYAMVDGNLVAFENGAELHNLRGRITPLLPVYATALSFICFGENMWSARFPHALAGLLASALLLFWASKGGIGRLLPVAILMLGNVSWFLFFRQCRYYGLSMFFTLLTAYVYWNWNKDGKHPRQAILLAASLLGLMFSYYIIYAGVTAAMIIDYVLWRRKETRLQLRDWLVILIPQVFGVLYLCAYWNPMDTGFRNWEMNDVAGVLKMFLMQIRDMNRSEFYSALLMILAIVLAFANRCKWVFRAVLAMCVITLFTAVLSDQNAKTISPMPYFSVANVRFMPSIIALCLLVEAEGILMLCGKRTFACVIVAFLAAFSNFGNGGVFLPEGVRSTPYLYANELANPPNTDPYKPTADWINKNIPPGALVYVTPNANAYPVMFLANKVTYAWQLEPSARLQAQFKNIPPAFFKGESLPDYIITFGSQNQELRDLVTKYGKENTRYAQLGQLNIFSRELFRPELFWRMFVDVPTSGVPDEFRVKIFKRDDLP